MPVEVHKEEGIYVPELIFGHLLTSSNYDDSQKKASRLCHDADVPSRGAILLAWPVLANKQC